MSAGEKAELLRNLERFESLPVEEQQRLRALDAALQSDPRQAELRQTMNRYYEWLKELSPVERAQLAQLPAEARVTRIRELRQPETMLADARPPAISRDDERAVLRWISEFAREHQDEILKGLSDGERQWFEPRPGRDDNRLVFLLARRREQQPAMPPVLEADLEKLRDKLSADAQSKLDGAGTLEEQRRLAMAWVRMALRSEFMRHAEGRRGRDGARQRVQELIEDLPAEEQKRLLALPEAEMWRELRKRDPNLRMPGFGGRGRGRWPGGPPRRFEGSDRPSRPMGPRRDFNDDFRPRPERE